MDIKSDYHKTLIMGMLFNILIRQLLILGLITHQSGVMRRIFQLSPNHRTATCDVTQPLELPRIIDTRESLTQRTSMYQKQEFFLMIIISNPIDYVASVQL